MYARVLLSFAVAIFAAAKILPADAATLIADGGFFDTPNGPYQTFGAGQQSSSFGGWTVSKGNVDLVGSYWSSATPGGGSIDLDGLEPGAIQQTFTAPTGYYMLNFWLSGNPDGGALFPVTKMLNVTAGDASENFSYEAIGNYHIGMLYFPKTLSFHSDGGQQTLTFASLDSSDSPFGPVVSGITLTSLGESTPLLTRDPISTVPLPAALPLFGAAIAGAFGLAKRRHAG